MTRVGVAPDILVSEKTKERWYNGNNVELSTLRKCLDLYDKQEINNVLVTYTQTMELLIAQVPTKSLNSRIDWSVANAMSPEWFGKHLTNRIQNSMLVSALLLSVTASSFVSPVTENDDSTLYRVNGYLNAICSAIFLCSIFLGICFIENAMCRAYCWSDRFILIIQYYFVKDISQVTAVLGAIVFPVTLLLPLQDIYLESDAIALYVLYAVYGTLVIYHQIEMTKSGAAAQNIKIIQWRAITDPDSGRLLPRFQPPTIGSLADIITKSYSENVSEVYQRMYNHKGKQLKDSMFGFIKV